MNMMDLIPIGGYNPPALRDKRKLQKVSLPQSKGEASLKQWSRQETPTDLSFESIFDAEIISEEDSHPIKTYKKTLLLKTYSFQYIDLYI